MRIWKLVLAIDRKGVRRAHPAHRAERHALELLPLRQVLPYGVGLAAGADARVADGHRADLARRGEIRLQQRRRAALRVGDVVEAERRVVGRQQRRHVHVEPQQIADGVGVHWTLSTTTDLNLRAGPSSANDRVGVAAAARA